MQLSFCYFFCKNQTVKICFKCNVVFISKQGANLFVRISHLMLCYRIHLPFKSTGTVHHMRHATTTLNGGEGDFK